MSEMWCWPQRVRAAGDVGADAADVGEARLLERGADGVGQAAALGDGEVAGVGARAGDDVAGQLGAGLGHADGVEARRRASGSCVLGEAAEHEVLAVGDAHLGAELALDRGERPELVGGDVAEPGVGVWPTRCPWPRRGRRWPRPSARRGRRAASVTGVPWPMAVGVTPVGDAGRRVAVLLHVVGDAARPAWTRRAGSLRSLRIRRCSSSKPMRVDEPLHAGPQLVVAVAVVVEDPQDRLDRGQQVLAWR